MCAVAECGATSIIERYLMHEDVVDEKVSMCRASFKARYQAVLCQMWIGHAYSDDVPIVMQQTVMIVGRRHRRCRAGRGPAMC